eukprot:61906_1
MADDYQRIKLIDKKIVYLIFGFIRQYRNQLPLDNNYYDIPTLVKYTCILFYYLSEYFTSHGRNITLLNDNSMATVNSNTCAAEDYESNYITIHGNIVVDLSSNMLYEWTIKIIKCVEGETYLENGDEISIGLTVKDLEYLDSHMIDSNNCAFCFDVDGEKESNRPELHKYRASKYGTGDIIKMVFDTKNAAISYYVNESYQGVAFENVSFTGKLSVCMAISMEVTKGNCVELLDFKMTDL